MQVSVKCGSNHLNITIRDADDVEILKQWFDNLISKATKSIELVILKDKNPESIT